jgi:hypothetical protein
VEAPIVEVAAESNQWKRYAISLAEWVGKDVYVAFVNKSYNCNILAIDDIQVFAYEHSFTFTNTTPEAIANSNSAAIATTDDTAAPCDGDPLGAPQAIEAAAAKASSSTHSSEAATAPGAGQGHAAEARAAHPRDSG